jgi:hypothetical protein
LERITIRTTNKRPAVRLAAILTHMGLTDNFLKIEKKFAWSFLGFLLAIIFGAFSIYTVYFMDNNPKLNFVIETNTKVLDLRENVRKLDIMYQGENIKESNKNLSIFKIKILNPSKVNILNTFYDAKDSLGFFLDKAEIVERPEIVEASNDYLKHNLLLSMDSTGQVKFSPVIIEGGEYFTIRLLALHKQNEVPVLKPFGKIAGIKEFKIIESYKTTEKKSFWAELIQGRFWIHVVRFFGYLLVIIFAALLIVIPSSLISDTISEKKRKRNVKNYKTKKNLPNTAERNLIYDMYLEFGLDYLSSVQKLSFDERLLKVRLRNYLRRKEKQKDKPMEFRDEVSVIRTGHIEYVSDAERPFVLHNRDSIISKLHKEKIIQLENNELVLNKQFVEDLNDFVSYLKLI